MRNMMASMVLVATLAGCTGKMTVAGVIAGTGYMLGTGVYLAATRHGGSGGGEDFSGMLILPGAGILLLSVAGGAVGGIAGVDDSPPKQPVPKTKTAAAMTAAGSTVPKAYRFENWNRARAAR